VRHNRRNVLSIACKLLVLLQLLFTIFLVLWHECRIRFGSLRQGFIMSVNFNQNWNELTDFSKVFQYQIFENSLCWSYDADKYTEKQRYWHEEANKHIIKFYFVMNQKGCYFDLNPEISKLIWLPFVFNKLIKFYVKAVIFHKIYFIRANPPLEY
jgi:hypothetical protein